MSIPQSLTDNQRELLVSLPYRVGVVVSDCDASGGEIAEEAEREVLKQILNGYAEQMLGSEGIQEIIQGTVARQDQWDTWSVEPDGVYVDCKNAMTLLGELGEVQDVNAYRNFVFGIAEAVALAFREYATDLSWFQRFSLYALYQTRKIKAAIKKKPYISFQQFLNISIKEHKVLENLADALDADYV